MPTYRGPLTRPMCFAAGTDAGNRSMREGGRTTWSDADYAAAVQQTGRLLVAGGFVTPDQARELGVTST